jgi:hypothetical protein
MWRHLQQKDSRVRRHESDRILTVTLQSNVDQWDVISARKVKLTSMFKEENSFETICKDSRALVQHADKACRPGLVRLVCEGNQVG